MIRYPKFCALMAALVWLVATPALAQKPFADVGKQPPITILIASTPWYPAFEKLVGQYEQQTGNKIKLDVVPFGGLLEKARNSVRSGQSPYDMLMLDTQWTITTIRSAIASAGRSTRRTGSSRAASAATASATTG